ncbi:hypothetical protein JCM11641_004918 [Rhodosporidiobolus odoratus]
MSTDPRPLTNIRALLFDTFGTLVDWEGSVTTMLGEEWEKTSQVGGGGEGNGKQEADKEVDWLKFTRRWRGGYMKRTREIAAGASGPGNIDDLHLEILNALLEAPMYTSIAETWSTQEKRKDLCQMWHRLNAWPDVKPGLEALRELNPPVILATLSNGTLRLLIDLAKHSSLPFSTHFSGDLLQSYKPNPKMYLGACGLLGYGDEEQRKGRGEVGMVASHSGDLKAAAGHGLRTIYIRRSTEDVDVPNASPAVSTGQEGGEVDVVLDGEGEGLRGLAELLRG